MRQTGLFGLPDHLRKLSATGDPLEVLARVVDFEIFRAPLEAALGYSDGSKGGRPAYDAVAMFKVLVLAARHTVSDERMEFLIRDRLSWLRFLGFDLGAPTPDRNTIWTFRERLVRAGAMDELFAAFDGELRRCGYLAMGGQIVDATLVSAPKQRDRDDEKRAIKAGKSAAEIWPDQPAKAAQKDTDARWTVKTGRRKNPAGSQRRMPDIAIPVFGYKNHVVIDRAYGFAGFNLGILMRALFGSGTPREAASAKSTLLFVIQFDAALAIAIVANIEGKPAMLVIIIIVAPKTD